MNEDERGITPPDVTAMTVEATGDFTVLITVERGNGNSVQTMKLSTMEWQMLAGLLETFGQGYSPAAGVKFKRLPIKRAAS